MPIPSSVARTAAEMKIYTQFECPRGLHDGDSKDFDCKETDRLEGSTINDRDDFKDKFRLPD